MSTEPRSATANAGANIALIKYWGVRDSALNIPLNDSVSFTLDTTRTTTTVTFDPALPADELVIGGKPATPAATERASRHLDILRNMAGLTWRARIVSENTFPMGAGIASSASAFAALTVAAAAALGLSLDTRTLSRIARRGSGSAARSIEGGFVWWHAGQDDASSFAEQIAPPDHWDLYDVVAVVEESEKKVSSAQGHLLATTSPFLETRLSLVQNALPNVRQAILDRDLATLGPLIETDALAMHFVMMSSHPRLYYWTGATLEILKAVEKWRNDGLPVWFTIDAGPNVHLICEAKHHQALVAAVRALPVVRDLIIARPGPGAFLL